MIVTTDLYKSTHLSLILASTWTLHLYKNNYTPLPGSVSGDFTECDFPGYSSVSIGAWSVDDPPDADMNDRSTGTSAEQFFTLAGDYPTTQTAYGYYVKDASGNLVYAERWSLQAVFQYDGDQVRQTPRYQLGQGF